MKKCKQCGVPSKNKTYEGDTNPYNELHCMPCASILYMLDMCVIAVNKPNIAGQVRKVEITVKIRK